MCAQRKKSFAHKTRSTKISRKKFIKNNKRKIVCAAFDTRVVIMKINGSTNKFTRSFGGGFCCCFLYFSFQFAHAKSQNRIKRSWKHKTMNAHKKYSLARIVKVDSFITIRCSFVYAWVMRRRGRRAIRSQPSTLIPQHKLWWIIYCKLIVKCPASTLKSAVWLFGVGVWWSGRQTHTRKAHTTELSFYCQIVGLLKRALNEMSEDVDGYDNIICLDGIIIAWARESLKPKQIVFIKVWGRTHNSSADWNNFRSSHLIYPCETAEYLCSTNGWLIAHSGLLKYIIQLLSSR